MTLQREPLRRGRELRRVQRRLRIMLDASRRRHVADVRFYQLLSDADRLPAFAKASARSRRSASRGGGQTGAANPEHGR